MASEKHMGSKGKENITLGVNRELKNCEQHLTHGWDPEMFMLL